MAEIVIFLNYINLFEYWLKTMVILNIKLNYE